MSSDLSVLTQRLERLERQNQILTRAMVGLLLFVGVLAFSAESLPAGRTIEAERFILRDSRGRARVTIGTPESSGAAVDTPADEPAIWISDERGIDRVIVTTEGMRLANDAGRPAASMTFMKKTGGQIRLYGQDGKLLYYAPE